jgi:hypothetical protein
VRVSFSYVSIFGLSGRVSQVLIYIDILCHFLDGYRYPLHTFPSSTHRGDNTKSYRVSHTSMGMLMITVVSFLTTLRVKHRHIVAYS